jgi:hypothetical protein
MPILHPPQRKRKQESVPHPYDERIDLLTQLQATRDDAFSLLSWANNLVEFGQHFHRPAVRQMAAKLQAAVADLDSALAWGDNL